MPIVSTQEFTSTEFDYIVVGGGTTGLSLAVRYVDVLARLVKIELIRYMVLHDVYLQTV